SVQVPRLPQNQPQLLVEGWVERLVLEGFVVRSDGGRVVAGRKVSGGEFFVSLRGCGLLPNDPAELTDCTAVVTRLVERQRQLKPIVGLGRAQLHGAAVFPDGADQVLVGLKSVPESEVNFRILGAKRHSAA